MRRSICYCEPSLALAGELSTWKFSYTTATSLPKGTRLKFDILSRGREVDWEIPCVNLKEKKNVIWAETPDGKVLPAKGLDKEEFSSAFEFVLSAEIKAGDTLSIFVGTTEKNKEESRKKSNRAQTSIQR